jgi:hypothetical protein
MRSRVPLLALGAAITAALAPSAAHAAAPTQIGFEGIAPNTYVTDQYLNSDGVQFGPPSKWGITDGALGGPDYIANDCSSTPYGVANGINGRSIGFNCGTEVTTTSVTTVHFTTFRRGVSIVVRSPSGLHGEVRIRTFAKGKVKVDDRTFATPKGQNVPYSVTRANADITNVVVEGVGGGGSGPLLLDDVSAPVDDKPPAAAFELGSPPPLEVAEGGTGKSTLPIVRYNGSTGPVSLSFSSLPDGISAANAEPNPVTGTEPAKLSVSAKPFAGGRKTLSITSASGAAGEFVGGAVKQDVNVITALEGGNSQASLVEACGNGEAKPSVRVRGGYRGRVDVEIRKLSGPATLLDERAGFQALGDGDYSVPVGISLPKGQGGPSVLEVTFRPENASPVTAQVRVFDYHVVMGNASSPWGKIPEYTPVSAGYKSIGFGNGGDRFTVEGRFPTGCTPEFQDGAGRKLDVISVDGGADKVGKVTLKLPKDPVSGYISANFGGQRLDRTANRLELLGFRNGPAVRQANSGAGAGTTSFTWADFEQVVGKDDAENCWPFGCWRSETAIKYWKKLQGDLAANNGLCFGYSSQALRFDRGLDNPTTFEGGAKQGWNLFNFADSSALKKAIVRWQVAWQDEDYQRLTSRIIGSKTVAQFKSQVQDQLRANDAAAIYITANNSAHAVVAYDVRDTADGGFEILTYNPNQPYDSNEESNKGTLDNAVTRSIIKVTAAGTWSGGIWSAGMPWTGPMTTIGVWDRLAPTDADPDMDAELASVGAVDGSTPRISSIRSGGDEALGTDGTAKPGTGVENHVVMDSGAGNLEYKLAAGKTYTLGITGGAGRYTQTFLGKGVATTVSGVRAAGQTDAVTLVPGQAEVGLRSGAGAATPATLDVVATKGKVTRSASVTVAGGRGATDSVAFTKDRGTLTLAHTGAPATVSVSLGSSGDGIPAGATTAPIKLGTGQRLELKPGSWKTPAAGVALVIRNNKGKVVRTGRAALKVSNAVKFGGKLAAKVGRGGKVTVTGLVAKPGTAPTLAITVEALKGGKVVKKATVLKTAKAGAFSIPVAVKGMPKGAKVRVTASLIDQGAGMATARRVVMAR